MRTQLTIEIISIEEDGYHIFTRAEINGQECRLLIDTGASRTVFDKDRASGFLQEEKFETLEHEKLSTGLGTSDMKSYVTTLHSFRIGELELHDYEAVLIDMTHVNGSFGKLKLPAIDGVLGGDILKKHKATIDYAKGVLRLSYPSRS